MASSRLKRDLQESEYAHLPVHWVLRKAPLRIYLKKTGIMAQMIRRSELSLNHVLDVGCGDGRGTHDLAKYFPGVEFVGVDYSERAIAFARLLVPNFQFHVQDAKKLSFTDESFELVVSREVIEHIPPSEVRSYLLEINRVLVSGGFVLLTTPSQRRPVSPKHFQHFTPEMLIELLTDAGFKITEIVGLGWWPKGHVAQVIYQRAIRYIPLFWRVRAYSGGMVLPASQAAELLVLAEKC